MKEMKKPWRLLAPRKKQQMSLSLSGEFSDKRGETPSAFCHLRRSFGALDLLSSSPRFVQARPGVELRRLLAAQAPTRQHALLGNPRLSLLEKLPTELTGVIFGYLDTDAIILLGLCSTTLWERAIGWVHIRYLHWEPPTISWAGTPIIYFCLRPRVLPQSLIDMLPDTPYKRMDEGPDTDEEHHRMHSAARRWLDDVVEESEKLSYQHEDLYRQTFLNHVGSAGIPESLHGTMAGSLAMSRIENRSKWLLRNLTEKEYIRMEGSTRLNGEATLTLTGHSWMTLDILLMWLIAWRGDGVDENYTWEQLEAYAGSSEDTIISPRLADYWPIWAGKWAGQSLDVVFEEDLGTDWTDRSTTVDLLSRKILRIMFAGSQPRNGEDNAWRMMWRPREELHIPISIPLPMEALSWRERNREKRVMNERSV